MQGRDNKEKRFKRAFFRKYTTSDGQEVFSIVTQIPRVKKNCLSLEGGGSACVAYAGFLKAFDEYGALDDIDTVAGVSGGAIAALAVALGYSGAEIAEKLEQMPMKDFLDYHDNYSWGISSAVGKARYLLSSKHRALSDGKKLLTFIEQLVEEKLGDKHAGFADLAKKREEEIRATGESRIKPNLLLNVTDFSGRIAKKETVSSEKPLLNLAHATYASGSFPGLLPDLMVNNKTDEAEPEDITKHVDTRQYKRYGDGGFKENLCRAALNNQQYYPPDVPHGVINSAGKREHIDRNPGVVYVKIDTAEEMNYIRDNINPPRENSGFFGYWFNLGNDALDIQDVDAIRREDVVFLPDNDVARTELDLPMDVKMGLVKTAEEVTREYLENRYHSVAHMAVFRGNTEAEAIRAWLDAQDFHDISDLISAYESMKAELLKDKLEKKKRDATDGFDSDKPTVKQLQSMINALNEYQAARFNRNARRDSGADKCPVRFINLSEPFESFDWELKIEEQMQQELENTEDKIAANIKGREQAYKALADYMHVYTKGKPFVETLASESESEVMQPVERDDAEEESHLEKFHGYFDDQILAVVAFAEYLSQLEEKRKDLQIKLGIDLADKHDLDLESSSEYKFLRAMLDDFNHELVKWPSLKAILLDSVPIVVIENPIPTYKMNIEFDMRNQLDRRIYLVAALLFLRQVKSPELHHFENEFNKFFQDEMPHDVTIDVLSKKLGVKGPDLQVALFRMEKLIHLFERNHYPSKEPELTIDVLIGASKYSHMRKVLRRQKQVEEDRDSIEMAVVFPTKPSSDASPSAAKSTIWHPLCSDSEGEKDEVPDAVDGQRPASRSL